MPARYTNCVNCGAPLHGNKCDYCGTEYGAIADEQRDNNDEGWTLAVDEPQDIVAEVDDDLSIDVLVGGKKLSGVLAIYSDIFQPGFASEWFEVAVNHWPYERARIRIKSLVVRSKDGNPLPLPLCAIAKCETAEESHEISTVSLGPLVPRICAVDVKKGIATVKTEEKGHKPMRIFKWLTDRRLNKWRWIYLR